ncbi:MAG: hypothetical protein H6677_15475 [Candidatus Obscuribacterales bacterium]|nr:hypothetical protein [Candidatus Obscuribacterales bacterium]
MRAKSLLMRKSPDARRFTRDEVVGFKLRSQSDPSLVPFEYKARSAFQNLMHFFTFRAGLGRNQCRQYGHVLPRENVMVKYSNHCRECGTPVTEMDQLRRA